MRTKGPPITPPPPTLALLGAELSCGSCVSFASAAVSEVAYKKVYGANATIDLSEGNLHFCSLGNKCSQGAHLYAVADAINSKGFLPEVRRP